MSAPGAHHVPPIVVEQPEPTTTMNDIGRVDASSGGASKDDGVSGGTIAGIVVGVLVALVLATVAIMWARGTPFPCSDNSNPYRGSISKTGNRAIPNALYSNPAYHAGGAEHAARSRKDSVA